MLELFELQARRVRAWTPSEQVNRSGSRTCRLERGHGRRSPKLPCKSASDRRSPCQYGCGR